MLAAKFVLAASIALPSAAQTVSTQLSPRSVPETWLSHAQAAQAAEQRGDFSTAAHEYEYLTSSFRASAEMQSNLGVALYFDHQWERAIAGFPKGHRAESESARAAPLQRTGVVSALEAGCRRAGARNRGTPPLLGCDRAHMAGLRLRGSIAIRRRGKTIRRSVSTRTRRTSMPGMHWVRRICRSAKSSTLALLQAATERRKSMATGRRAIPVAGRPQEGA